MKYKQRTHNCGELRISDANKNVTLNGWVAGKRDLGGILFVDLRDRYGITQLKINQENVQLCNTASKLGNEFVISASGTVMERENKNKNIPTGDVEILVSELQILNTSEIPPFVIEDNVKAYEDLRLKYRYMDIRRRPMLKNLEIRNKVYHIVRNFYRKHNFIEIETPVLMKSTPEGARDFLVPSRIHKGKFYALPQSPQTYKQILMVAGLDRYVQICKCFRDEDLRADRQPEFTQIDLEMSFVTQNDIFKLSEDLFKEIWKKILGIEINTPFPELSYDDVISRFGTDKPDFRIHNISEIKNLTEIFNKTEFKLFQSIINDNGYIYGLKVNSIYGKNNNLIEFSRKVIDNYTEFVKNLGLSGIVFIKCTENGELSSSVLKYLSESEIKSLKDIFSTVKGDSLFLLSGEKMKVLNALGQLRFKLASDYNLIDENKYEFLWIKDFPLFKYDEEEKKYYGEHHIFTMPKDEYINLLDSDSREEIESIRADCYDLVLNGNEIGSGSLRIYKPDIQEKVFRIIGLTSEEAKEKFGFLLEAFRYGAPPHGGIAFGYDRIIAVLCGLTSIREVIAFPKTVSAASLMDNCPSPVTNDQLKDLNIQTLK